MGIEHPVPARQTAQNVVLVKLKYPQTEPTLIGSTEGPCCANGG